MSNSTGKIPYSLCMRESAFSRVQAPKCYATLQVRNKVTIDDLAKHIAEHNSKYSRADITAISIELVHCFGSENPLLRAGFTPSSISFFYVQSYEFFTR